MFYTEKIPLLGDWFELMFVENEGMAFGMHLEGPWGKLALSLFRIILVIAIGLYLRKLIREKAHKGLITAIGLIFAGAVGNIIDSMFYGMAFTDSVRGTGLAEWTSLGTGYASDQPMGGFLFGSVVDMLHFDLSWPDWMPWMGGKQVFGPIFNIADVAISAGVFLIIIKQRTYFGENSFFKGLKDRIKKKPVVATEGAGNVELDATEQPPVKSEANIVTKPTSPPEGADDTGTHKS